MISLKATLRSYVLSCLSVSFQFQVLTSSSTEAIPTLRPHLGADKGAREGFSLVLMDHEPQRYLSDLLALEREELLSPSGCSILMINRRERRADIRHVLAHIRVSSDPYSIISEQHFVLEIFYQKKPTDIAL